MIMGFSQPKKLRKTTATARMLMQGIKKVNKQLKGFVSATFVLVCFFKCKLKHLSN